MYCDPRLNLSSEDVAFDIRDRHGVAYFARESVFDDMVIFMRTQSLGLPGA